ncbi:MAG: DnaJ domain-containing protein [Patescibacteria group bacterium]|nr:DnaJ domain-containing protein [Patescibacteria group bacterium]
MARSGNRWSGERGGRGPERARSEANQKYALLGVDRNATTAEINVAIREKAKILHPDTNQIDEEQFKTLSAARDILKDPVKRALLDMTDELGYSYEKAEKRFAQDQAFKAQVQRVAEAQERARTAAYERRQAEAARRAPPPTSAQAAAPSQAVARRQAAADRQTELDAAYARRMEEQRAAREAEEAAKAEAAGAAAARPEEPEAPAPPQEEAPPVDAAADGDREAESEPAEPEKRDFAAQQSGANPQAEDMHERLGVAPDAEKGAIKEAYREAGKKYRGDAEAMDRLREAFDTLSGGKRRAAEGRERRAREGANTAAPERPRPAPTESTLTLEWPPRPRGEPERFHPGAFAQKVNAAVADLKAGLRSHHIGHSRAGAMHDAWQRIEAEQENIRHDLARRRRTRDAAERAAIEMQLKQAYARLAGELTDNLQSHLQSILVSRSNRGREREWREREDLYHTYEQEAKERQERELLSNTLTDSMNADVRRWADEAEEEKRTKKEEHDRAEAEREHLRAMVENIELESQKDERWGKWGEGASEGAEEEVADGSTSTEEAEGTGALASGTAPPDEVPPQPSGAPPPPTFGSPPPPGGAPPPPPGAPKPKSSLQQAADRLKAARIAEDAAMERKDVAEAARFRAEAVTAREEVARLRADAASASLAGPVQESVGARREKLLAAEGVVQARDANYYRKKLFSRAAAWARGDNRGGPPEWEMNEAAAKYAGALEARLAAKLGAGRDPEKKALSADFAARVANRYRRRMIHGDVIVRGEKAREAERARVLSEKEAGIVANGLQWAVRKNRELDQRYGWWWRGTRIAAFAALGAAPAAAGGAMAFAGAAGLRGLRGLAGFHFGTTVGTATGAGIGKAYERTLGKRSAERLAKSAGTEAKTSTDIEEMRAAYRAGNADAIARNRRNVEMAAALASSAGFSILAAGLSSTAPAHLPGAGHAPVPPPAHEALPATHAPPPAVAHPEHAPSTAPAPGAHPTSSVPGSAAPTPEHPALPEHPAAPVAPPESAHPAPAPEAPSHPAPPPAEEPKVPSLSVEVRPGLGYEAMLKDMWRQLQGQHLDGANVPPGSDLAKLLAADAKHIDGLVHRMALDPSHGFARADGASAFVGRGAHLRLWPDGSVRFEDGAHAPTVHAPAGARMVPPAAHAPQAAGINPDKSADYFNQQVEERLARGEPIIPPPAYTPLPEAPAHPAAHAGAAAHAPAPHAESPAPLPRAPHPAEPSLPAGEGIPPPSSTAPGHPAFNGVIEPPPTHDDININHSAPGYLPGRSPLPHSIDAAAHVGAPESFVNAQGVPIDSVHGAVYFSGNGAPIAYAHDYATRLTLAQEYAKGHPGVAVWVQAEKPVVMADGTLRPWVESVTYRRGWFRSVFDITKAPTAPDQIAVVNPDTFVRQAYPPPAPATVVA